MTTYARLVRAEMDQTRYFLGVPRHVSDGVAATICVAFYGAVALVAYVAAAPVTLGVWLVIVGRFIVVGRTLRQIGRDAREP